MLFFFLQPPFLVPCFPNQSGYLTNTTAGIYVCRVRNNPKAKYTIIMSGGRRKKSARVLSRIAIATCRPTSNSRSWRYVVECGISTQIAWTAFSSPVELCRAHIFTYSQFQRKRCVTCVRCMQIYEPAKLATLHVMRPTTTMERISIYYTLGWWCF